MKKLLIGFAVLAVLGAGGYGALNYRSASVLAAYSDKNINLGSVGTAEETCATDAGHARLICLADALIKSATPELLTNLQRPYTVADAKKWSNFPPVGYPNRVGPTLSSFTPEQLVIVKSLLKEAAGIAANEGYDELEQTLNADDYLKANTSDSAGFSSGNYHIAFLGKPSNTGTWQLYFGGHHFAFSNTYRDGVLIGAKYFV